MRAFVQRHFGRDSLPGAPVVTVADLVLSDDVPEELAHRALAERGFADPARALLNLRRIGGEDRTLFARLAIIACDVLAAAAGPRHGAQQLGAVPPRAAGPGGAPAPDAVPADAAGDPPQHLLGEPVPRRHARAGSGAPGCHRPARRSSTRAADERRHRARSCGRSRAASPGLERMAGRPAAVPAPGDPSNRRRATSASACPRRASWRRSRTWPTGSSRAALERQRGPKAWRRGPRFCIVAFGKLGGRELNYSSDIDLLGICASGGRRTPIAVTTHAAKASRRWKRCGAISRRTPRRGTPTAWTCGCVRTAPRASSSSPCAALDEYYAHHAALWEVQALLKARPVAGDPALGGRSCGRGADEAACPPRPRGGGRRDRHPAQGGAARPLPKRAYDDGHQDGSRRAARRGVPRAGPAALPRARSPASSSAAARFPR